MPLTCRPVSLPEARQFDLCSKHRKRFAKMDTQRANWDGRTTALLLDLVQKQKDQCHWGHNSPSNIGWSNIVCEFNSTTQHGYPKKALQKKYHDLKRAYFNFCSGLTHTGLGHDPLTGDMAADPSWLADGPGESSQKGTEMFKLHNAVSSWSIFWDAPQVTKVSCLLPEAMNLRRPPSDSSRTPKNMSADPLHQHSGGQSSKRLTRDHSVNSPYKKSSRNHSIDKTLDILNNMIKRSVMREQKRHKKCKDTYREESAQVKQILREDGYKEGDEVFMQVLNLTLDDNRRHAFLDLETKVGPLQWVKVSWAFSATTSK